MIWLLVSLCCVGLGYLLGSIPTGYWVGWTLAGVDIRQQGSGSTGATNVLRTVGKGPALIVLIVDVGKGVAAVWLAQWLVLLLGSTQFSGWTVSESEGVMSQTWVARVAWMGVIGGWAAVIGHSRSLWLNFKGGKSVATGLGVLSALAWPVALCTLGVWLLGLGISRIVSLSSLTAAVAAPLFMLAFDQHEAYVLFASAAGLYVVGTHRRNIERLLAGTEPRIPQKLADTTEG